MGSQRRMGADVKSITSSPVSEAGLDDLTNLQPLRWQNNRAKDDSYPANPGVYCAVQARR